MKIPNDLTIGSGLVGWFDFEVTDNLTFVNRGDIASCSSLHDSDIVLNEFKNSSTDFAPCLMGGAAEFKQADTNLRATLATSDTPLASLATNNANFTMFAVFRSSDVGTTSVAGLEQCMAGWSSSSDADTRVLFHITTNGGLGLRKFSDNNTQDNATTAGDLVSANVWTVAGCISDTSIGADGGAKIIGPDGAITEDNAAFVSANFDTLTANRFNIGSLFSQTASQFLYFQGAIKEVVVYDDVLSDDDALAVWEYLRWKHVTSRRIQVAAGPLNIVKHLGAHPREDVTAVMQKACTAMMHGGATEIIIPPGHYYLTDTITIGTDNTDANRGGIIRGAGAGSEFSATTYDTDLDERHCGQTILRWKGDDATLADPMFRVKTWGTSFRDLMFMGADVASRRLKAFIEIYKDARDAPLGSQTAIGKLRVFNCFFFSDLTHGPETRGIVGARNETGTGQENEDESHLEACCFQNVAYPLELKHRNQVGWYIHNWHVTNATEVFRVSEDGGGGLHVYGMMAANPSTSTMTILSLRNTASPTGSSCYYLNGVRCDSGDNSNDIVLAANNGGSGSEFAQIIFDHPTTSHDTQTVSLINLTDFYGMVSILNGHFCPRACGSAGFAHIQGKSAAAPTLLTLHNCHTNVDLTDANVFSSTSSNHILRAFARKKHSTSAGDMIPDITSDTRGHGFTF